MLFPGKRRLVRVLRVAARLFFGGAATLGGVYGAEPPESGASWAEGRKLLQGYCFDCHAEGMSKGSFSLDELLEGGTGQGSEGWLKAWKIVRHGFMPPAGEEAPNPAERKAITEWIARQHLGVNYDTPDPGRVTLRRLNRMEYDYTVQDLFGMSFAADQDYSSDGAAATLQLRDRLPPDDTAFGFDNIGDFQSVSPALLEKYFDIAEYVVSRVVVVGGAKPPVREISRQSLKVDKKAEAKLAEHQMPFEVAEAGTYRVEMQFTLGGWQEYGGEYRFKSRVDDVRWAEEQIEIGGYKTHRFSREFDLAAGSHTLMFSTEATKPDSRGKLEPLELRPKARLIGPLGQESYEYPEPHRRIFAKGDPPQGTAERQAYAREILERVASRAFRRPVEKETLDGLTRLAMSHDDFHAGVGQAITAILTSPKFLFRAETQPNPDDPKVTHPIDPYALASRLSYLLWLSLPDEELTRLAAEGKLRSDLRGQVKRMLADRKAERFFEDFPGQWLRTRNVLMTSITRDEMLNPVRGLMKRETELFFEHIAREDRDLIELLTADYTFLNQRLAEYYGIKEVQGDEFRKVALTPESKRGGILTQGSFLVASSNPSRTSPVKRGLFVLENLLATEPPPPPPGVPPLEEPAFGQRSTKTTREQLEEHRANKSCASCHAHFDPIGLVLENYDLIGRWRDEENGVKIDPTTRTVQGETLNGIEDLRRALESRKEKFYHALSEKLLTYALGRGLEPADSVTVDQIAAKVNADGGRFSTLLFAVVESPAFQMRRGDAGVAKIIPRKNIPATPPPEKRRPVRRLRQAAPVNAPAAEQPANALNANPEPR